MINATHPDLDITPVLDMRIILNHAHLTSSHTSRYNRTTLHPSQSMITSDLNKSISDYPDYTYRLRHVPLSLKYEDLKHNLSYYRQIEHIQEVENLPPTQRELLITFDQHARIGLLDHIWAVNV